MAEVARALVLPDLHPPTSEHLLALLLVWDAIDIEMTYSSVHSEPEIRDVSTLEDEGLVRVRKIPFNPKYPPEKRKPFEEEWSADMWRFFAKRYDRDKTQQMALAVGSEMAALLISHVQAGLRIASERGLAPIAATPNAAKAACLPPLEAHAGVAEGALINAATRAVQVVPDTTVEDVLAFRNKNAALMGRFRGALVELAQSITASSPALAAEQAYAIIQNRIEPALADLDDALARSRISYAWKTLMGATAVAASAPVSPVGALAKGGEVAVQPVRYAFDRDRLVRGHPFGLLYRARQAFGGQSLAPPEQPITNPEDELKAMFSDIVRVASEASIQAVGGESSEPVTTSEVAAALQIPEREAAVLAKLINTEYDLQIE